MEYTIKNGQMRVYGSYGGGMEYDKKEGKWVRFTTLCDVKKPIGIYMTSNCDDIDRKKIARHITGAKLLYSWERGNYIDDPYGRDYRVGTIKCEIWDFREVLGCEKSIEDCVDYEISEMLKMKRVI